MRDPLSRSSLRAAMPALLCSLGLACGGAPPPPAEPPPAPVASASAAPEAPAPAPAERPASVAAWLHVEDPARLSALAASMSDPPGADASCAKGDLTACLALVDPRRPADFAGVEAGKSNVSASGFSVASAAAFREAVARQFRVTEPQPGRLRLEPSKEGKEGKEGKDGDPADADAPTRWVCDLRAADRAERRVVCGTEEGVAQLGPWLLTSPRPAARGDLASAEFYPEPIRAVADRELPRGGGTLASLRELARDFTGATLRLAAGDAPGAPLQLALDMRMKAESHLSRVLLTPPSSGPVPEAFARLPRGTTAALYLPGGGPIAALLEEVDPFLHSLETAGQKPAADALRAAAGQPVACGYALDLDEAERAVALARKAPEKDSKKTNAALDEAFNGFMVCGLHADARAVEPLVRKALVALAKKDGPAVTVRPAVGLGLPAGSFLVETRTPARPHTPKEKGAKEGPKTDVTLVVADGDTLWMLGAESHLPGAVRLARRMLARPRAPVTTFATPPGTLASATVTTLFGGFFMDLLTHSTEDLGKTLATTAPGALKLTLSQRKEGDGGALSLRVDATPDTLKILSPRLAMMALPVMMGVAVLAATATSGDK